VIGRVLSSTTFLAGIACMTVGFFSLMMALSWADVSLVGPASASLTYISNAVSARVFLHERVDGRRWAAAVFVAGGVALLAS
jgi:drug/metabolite transporter (DMT)-like permease